MQQALIVNDGELHHVADFGQKLTDYQHYMDKVEGCSRWDGCRLCCFDVISYHLLLQDVPLQSFILYANLNLQCQHESTINYTEGRDFNQS